MSEQKAAEQVGGEEKDQRQHRHRQDTDREVGERQPAADPPEELPPQQPERPGQRHQHEAGERQLRERSEDAGIDYQREDAEEDVEQPRDEQGGLGQSSRGALQGRGPGSCQRLTARRARGFDGSARERAAWPRIALRALSRGCDITARQARRTQSEERSRVPTATRSRVSEDRIQRRSRQRRALPRRRSARQPGWAPEARRGLARSRGGEGRAGANPARGRGPGARRQSRISRWAAVAEERYENDSLYPRMSGEVDAETAAVFAQVISRQQEHRTRLDSLLEAMTRSPGDISG